MTDVGKEGWSIYALSTSRTATIAVALGNLVGLRTQASGFGRRGGRGRRSTTNSKYDLKIAQQDARREALEGEEVGKGSVRVFVPDIGRLGPPSMYVEGSAVVWVWISLSRTLVDHAIDEETTRPLWARVVWAWG